MRTAVAVAAYQRTAIDAINWFAETHWDRIREWEWTDDGHMRFRMVDGDAEYECHSSGSGWHIYRIENE